MLDLAILFVLGVWGFALDSISDSLLPEPGLLLPLADQSASLFDLDLGLDHGVPGVSISEGGGGQAGDWGTSLWEGKDAAVSSVPPGEEESIFSRPFPSTLSSSSDEDSNSNDFLSFDIVSDCSASEPLTLLLSAAISGESRARRRRSDDSKSCDNPSLPPNTSPMTTNPPPHSSDDDNDDENHFNDDHEDNKNDPLIPLAGGAGSALLGISFFSECAAATTYALPVIYCNAGTKDDVRFTGKRDFQFRGKFDTWTLLRHEKGMLIFGFES